MEASGIPGEALPGHPRDPPLVGEGEVPVRLAQGEPGDVDGLLVGVVLDGQFSADCFEEVVVHVFVDAPVAHGEPIVDRPELDEDLADDSRLLGDLPGGGLGQGFLPFDVPLGQAPLDAAGSIAPRDDRDARHAVVHIDDDTTGGALLDRGQPSRHHGGLGGGMAHGGHCNQRGVRVPGSFVVMSLLRWILVAPSSPSSGAGAPAAPVAPVAAMRTAVAHLAPVVPLLTELGALFAEAGHELALVGGPVRDAFLGRTSPDLDFTTSARPEEIEPLLARWGSATWDMGREFGTIGARRGGTIVEVTTYRADAYDGVTRKPVVAFGDSLEEDLLRRDFTMNAMALRLPDLTFVDPYAGLADLAARTLRTPGPPEVSFGDDPLRMMRAARFVSQLAVAPAPDVLDAMTTMASSLEIVSAERVRDELVKLLLGAHPRAGLEVLVRTGLAAHVLPELPALKLELDEHHRHKDVYEHSLTVLEQAIALEGDDVPGPDLVLRLAALLHDIGKPATRRFEDGGGVSFHHHEVVGAKLTAKRLRALRFDKDTIKAVSRLVELHLRFHGYGQGQWTDSAVRRYVTDAGGLLGRLHRLTRADCTTRNQRKARALAATYDDLERRIAVLLEAEELGKVRPDLDGHEIADALGIAPGPALGRAYKHLLGLRLDEGPLGKDVARERLRAWWAEQPESS